MSSGELPVKAFPSQRAFETWLSKNHAKVPGLWLKFARKASGIKSVTYAEAVEVCLCYGWIDGQAKSFDENYTLQRFTPRRSRSRWSKINRTRAERLIAEGRMQPAGLTAIEQAKSNGAWDAAYDSPSAATVPDDLAKALSKNKKAKAFFETLDSRNRYAILYRIQDAKKPETRARRIATFVQMLEEGRTLY